ncbi:hypothetical protein ACL02R_23480 [Streptomyces sp. MS19]|uniref:hypothetical protein n=1 Tax=Streptomyces sp. MS19 TaxID=3385972 RepID=UPI0039A281B6
MDEGGPGEPWWVDNQPQHQLTPQIQSQPQPEPQPQPQPQPQMTVPVGSGGRVRPLGNAPVNGHAQYHRPEAPPQIFPQAEEQQPHQAEPQQAQDVAQLTEPDAAPPPPLSPADIEAYYAAYRQYVLENGEFPNARQLSRFLNERHGVTDGQGSLLSEPFLRDVTRGFRERYSGEMGTGV